MHDVMTVEPGQRNSTSWIDDGEKYAVIGLSVKLDDPVPLQEMTPHLGHLRMHSSRRRRPRETTGFVHDDQVPPNLPQAGQNFATFGHANRLRNIHEAAVNVTAPMTASGHNSGSSVPNPAPSR